MIHFICFWLLSLQSLQKWHFYKIFVEKQVWLKQPFVRLKHSLFLVQNKSHIFVVITKHLKFPYVSYGIQGSYQSYCNIITSTFYTLMLMCYFVFGKILGYS